MGVGEPWAYGETNTSVPDSGLLGWRVQVARVQQTHLVPLDSDRRAERRLGAGSKTQNCPGRCPRGEYGWGTFWSKKDPRLNSSAVIHGQFYVPLDMLSHRKDGPTLTGPSEGRAQF